MKQNLFCFVFFITTSVLFAQQLKCCNTIEDVKETLAGKWKQVNTESKEIYNYEFEGKYYGNLETYEAPTDENVVAIIVSCEPGVTVLKTEKGFQLEYTYMLGTSVSDIKYLSKTKMILIEEDNIEVEYKKLKN